MKTDKISMFTKSVYTLPSYWASYLINGDSSGLHEGEQATIEAWLAKHGLPRPVDCSAVSRFSRWNNAGTLAGDVREYTFLLPVAA